MTIKRALVVLALIAVAVLAADWNVEVPSECEGKTICVWRISE